MLVGMDDTSPIIKKYTVKSGYQMKRVYPDKCEPRVVYGPTVDLSKAFCWIVKCPPKIKHFL